MLDFSAWIDLPLVWSAILALAVLLYVVLDGFDLGVGILFPFAPTHDCRSAMMNSIAPFWDGNETWLVMGGAGLFAAFPLAYAILMPAFYLPLILMLLGLILRGVAFEFRFKAEGKSRRIWDYCFHFGSLGATFMQGMVLGSFVQGVESDGRGFTGGAFDWLSAFSVLTGMALVAGYALLGATWLIFKTADKTQSWARRAASYLLALVGMFMAIVSLCVPFLNRDIASLWFSTPNIYYLMPVPLLTGACFLGIWRAIAQGREYLPFILTVAIFLLGYVGLGISLYPWMVPFELTFTQAAAIPESQSLLLVVAAPLLPIILCYTAYSFYVFRGKANAEEAY